MTSAGVKQSAPLAFGRNYRIHCHPFKVVNLQSQPVARKD